MNNSTTVINVEYKAYSLLALRNIKEKRKKRGKKKAKQLYKLSPSPSHLLLGPAADRLDFPQHLERLEVTAARVQHVVRPPRGSLSGIVPLLIPQRIVAIRHQNTDIHLGSDHTMRGEEFIKRERRGERRWGESASSSLLYSL